MNSIERFNESVAKRLSRLLLSMTVFWLLNLGLFIGLLHPGFLVYFQALSSNWYQGIALPIIGLSGALAAKETMGLIRETHDAVMELLTSLHRKHDALHTKINRHILNGDPDVS